MDFSHKKLLFKQYLFTGFQCEFVVIKQADGKPLTDSRDGS